MQIRWVGGLIGLAVATSVGNNWVQSRLRMQLSPAQLAELLQSINTVDTFPQMLQDTVRSVYADGFKGEMKVVIGFCVAELLFALGMWKNPQIKVA